MMAREMTPKVLQARRLLTRAAELYDAAERQAFAA